jgi:hypothetical protein
MVKTAGPRPPRVLQMITAIRPSAITRITSYPGLTTVSNESGSTSIPMSRGRPCIQGCGDRWLPAALILESDRL